MFPFVCQTLFTTVFKSIITCCLVFLVFSCSSGPLMAQEYGYIWSIASVEVDTSRQTPFGMRWTNSCCRRVRLVTQRSARMCHGAGDRREDKQVRYANSMRRKHRRVESGSECQEYAGCFARGQDDNPLALRRRNVLSDWL